MVRANTLSLLRQSGKNKMLGQLIGSASGKDIDQRVPFSSYSDAALGDSLLFPLQFLHYTVDI